MAEQFLNGAQVGTFLQHVRAEGMAQRMGMNIRGQPLGDGNFLDDAAHASRGQPSPAAIDKKCRQMLICVGQNFLSLSEP